MKGEQNSGMRLTRRDVLRSGVAGAGILMLPDVLSPASGSAAVVPEVDAISLGHWFAGDTHVHCDHSSDGSFIRQAIQQMGPGNVSVADQIGQGVRIGLDWMPLTDDRTYDQHWDPLWTSPDLLLVPGEEANGAPHAICLGAVDVVVDGARPAGSASHRHLQQSIWEAHAQDAVWGVAHPDTVNEENLSAIGPDLIEVWNASGIPDDEIDYAEARWNAGFRTGVTGACDCHFREVWGIEGPGQPTTFVLAPVLGERAILDGLRAGRTVVSSSPVGPLVTLEADLDGDGVYEAVGGDEVRAEAGQRRATLRARVQRGIGTTLLLYAAPGRSAGPVASVTIQGLDETHVLPISIKPGTSWWRAELRRVGQPAGIGLTPANDVPKQPDQLQSLASPIFVTTSVPAVPIGVTTTPAASGTDHGVVVIGEPGVFTGFPDVAVASGRPHVVAEQHRDRTTSVVYCGPGRNETVIASGSARLPKVAARDYDVWVVWQDERAGQLPRTPQIFLRHSADGGRSWGNETRLSDGRGRQERPAIALTSTGSPLVAWQAATGGAVDIWAMVVGRDPHPVNLSATNKTVTRGNVVDTRSAIYPASLFPDVAVLPDGSAAVVWQDNRYDTDPGWTGHMLPVDQGNAHGSNPDASEPMLAILGANATTWSNPIRVIAGNDQAACHPAIGAAADGTLVCAWDSRRCESSGVNARIRAAISHDSGKTWSAPVDIDPSPDYYAQRPRVAASTRGAHQIVWYDSRSADWRWQIRSATLRSGDWRPDGSVLAAGACTWPAVDSGIVVATSDRGARPQRDRTHRIVLTALT